MTFSARTIRYIMRAADVMVIFSLTFYPPGIPLSVSYAAAADQEVQEETVEVSSDKPADEADKEESAPEPTDENPVEETKEAVISEAQEEVVPVENPDDAEGVVPADDVVAESVVVTEPMTGTESDVPEPTDAANDSGVADETEELAIVPSDSGDTGDTPEADGGEGADTDTSGTGPSEDATPGDGRDVAPVAEVAGEAVADAVERGVWRENADGSMTVAVTEGRKYEYRDSGFSIRFSHIDEEQKNPGEITVREVMLTAAQKRVLGALTDTAWDVTSTMRDGTFTYELTFPLNQSVVDTGKVGVAYVEDRDDLDHVGKAGHVDAKDVIVDEDKGKIVADSLDHFTIFYPTIDVDGPNDQPGQKDLTKFAFERLSATGYEALFSWDETDISNPIDACILVDSDDDSGVNYALCVHYDSSGSYDTVAYECSDRLNKPENCWNATSVADGGIVPFTASCTVSQTNDDPFGAGDDAPYDRTAICAINVDPGFSGNLEVNNVCSYPSGPPNSDASDCLAYTAGGFIRIGKTANPDDSTVFAFTVGDGGTFTRTTSITGSGVSELISVPVGTYTVGESVPGGWTLDTASCDDGASSRSGSSVTGVDVDAGETVYCSFGNTKDTGTIVVKKVAVGGDDDFVFTGTAAGTINDGETITVANLVPGTYTATEAALGGWSLTGVSCNDADSTGSTATRTATFHLAAYETVTCTFTNRKDPTLTVVKNVINDDGGLAVVDDFGIVFSGGTLVFNAGVTVGSTTTYTAQTVTLDPAGGPYTLSENDVDGYTEGVWDCGTPSQDGLSTTIAPQAGDETVCTIVNDDQAATLTLVKNIAQNYGGTEAATAWTLAATGPMTVSGATGGPAVTAVSVPAGTYDLSESGPTGYEASVWICAGGTQDDADTVTLASGQSATCTITNSDLPATLTVCKFDDVVGDGTYDGGEAMLAGWTMTLADAGGTQVGEGQTGQNGCVSFNDLTAGVYHVTETSAPGWTNISPLTQDVTLTLADDETVYFGNQQLGSIVVHKDVTDPAGGSVTDTTVDFTITLDGTNPQTVTDGGTVTYNGLVAGTHTVAESVVPDGYTLYSITPDTDAAAAGAQVTVLPGQTTDVYVTNRQETATLTVTKTVYNDNGGTAAPDDFALTVGGNGVTSGVSYAYAAHTALALDETLLPGYVLGSVACASDVDGSANTFSRTVLPQNVTLVPGEHVSCTIINDDVFGRILVKKETLPDGSMQAFGFTADYGTFSLADGGTHDSGTLVPNIYAVAENLPAGWDLTGATCDDGSPVTAVALSDNEIVTCTFTNTQRAQITVVKDAVNDDAQDFTFHDDFGTGNPDTFLLDDDNDGAVPGQRTFEVVPGTYGVSEDAVEGWQQESVSCDNGATPAAITVGPGEHVTCTFVNEELASVTLVKETLGADGTFDFTLAGEGLPATAQLVTSGGTAQQIFAGLDRDNTYAVAETVPDGWVQVSATCNNGDPVDAITPEPGESIICTFVNGKLPTLTLAKTVRNDHGGVATREDFLPAVNGTSVAWDAPGTYAPGPYTATETALSGGQGYAAGAWGGDCAADGTVTLAYGDAKTCTITNDDIAPVLTACKYRDAAEDGTYNGNEELLGGWEMTLTDAGGGQVATGATSADVQTTGFGCVTFGGLTAGTAYTVAETVQGGWFAPGGVTSQSTTLALAEERTVFFGNQEYGNVVVTKFSDDDGDGVMGDGEVVLGGWTMRLDPDADIPAPTDQVTNEMTGEATFSDVFPGTYTLSEAAQTGWDQTGIYCDGQDARGTDGTLPVAVVAGETVRCYVGNREAGVLYIQKTNDAVTVKDNGDLVTYTLTVRAAEGPVHGVTVTDLPPEDFAYVDGTWTAVSSLGGAHVGGLELDHVYASPGIWDLGDMQEGETVTLTYQAEIGAPAAVDPGTYPDVAYAGGTGRGGALLALADGAGYVNDNFVGTDVTVADASAPPTARVTTDHTEVVEKVKKTKTVDRYLPATGAGTLLPGSLSLLFGFGCLLAGLGTVLRFGDTWFAPAVRRGVRSGVRSGVRAAARRVGTLLALVLTVAALSADAATASLLVRAEEPKAAFNVVFAQDFVALDSQSRTVTVECLVRKPGEASYQTYATYMLQVGGDSGTCDVPVAVLDRNGTYSLMVRAVAGADAAESAAYDVAYDAAAPDKPRYVEKDEKSDCRNDVTFRTAADGQTVRVELYASEHEDFTAGAGTRVADIAVGPDTKYVYVHHLPSGDCGDTFYYAVRAFDDAGNPSPVREEDVEETVEKKVIVEKENIIRTVVLAPPVTDIAGTTEGTAGTAGTADTDGEDGAVAGAETVTGAGEVLGAETTRTETTSRWTRWLSVAGLLFLVAVIPLWIRARRRRGNSEER